MTKATIRILFFMPVTLLKMFFVYPDELQDTFQSSLRPAPGRLQDLLALQVPSGKSNAGRGQSNSIGRRLLPTKKIGIIPAKAENLWRQKLSAFVAKIGGRAKLCSSPPRHAHSIKKGPGLIKSPGPSSPRQE
jgi:hypothetical protein